VSNLSDYGVVEFDPEGRPIALQEKPLNSPGRHAIPGLYDYDDRVVELAAGLRPSSRGELEITDLNRLYLEEGSLRVVRLDTGNHDSLLEAGEFVRAIQSRQGLRIARLEEIAFHKGWLSEDELVRVAGAVGPSAYGDYLRAILERAAN